MTEENKELKTEEKTSASENSTEETQAKPDETSQQEKQEKKEEKPVEPIEKVELTKEEHDALLKKAEVSDNYKKENEGYRQVEKEDRLKNLSPKKPEEEQPQEYQQPESLTISTETQEDIRKDYLSKQANIVDKIMPDIQSLTNEQYAKIENKILGAFDSVYSKSLKEGRYVAEGQLEREAKELINWTKGSDNTQEIETARAEGAVEATKAQQADIGTLGSSKKPSSVNVSDEATQMSEDTEGRMTEERAQEIIDNRKNRQKEWNN